MQITQRCILLVVVSLLLCAGIRLHYMEKEEKVFNDWEAIRTERFLKRICKSRVLSYENYLLFCEAVSISRKAAEVRVEEYKREQNLQNEVYYSVVSWDEIKDVIRMEGNYCFTVESIIVIEVRQKGRESQNIKKYYGWVMEE